MDWMGNMKAESELALSTFRVYAKDMLRRHDPIEQFYGYEIATSLNTIIQNENVASIPLLEIWEHTPKTFQDAVDKKTQMAVKP